MGGLEFSRSCRRARSSNTFVIQWDAATVEDVRVSDGCFGRCDRLDHPLMMLKHLLFQLKEAHIDCLPNKYRLQELCGSFPEPPPPYRVLCAVCLDDCGVDIPEGVAPEGVGLCATDHCEPGEAPPCFMYCPS